MVESLRELLIVSRAVVHVTFATKHSCESKEILIRSRFDKIHKVRYTLRQINQYDFLE